MRLCSDTHLHCLSRTCLDQLQEAQTSSSTVLGFLLRFQKICSAAAKVEERVEAGEAEEDVGQVELNEPLVRCLLVHLEALGWSRVQQVTPDFTSFTLRTKDTQGRVHLLQVRAGDGYPREEPQVEADLPDGLEYDYDQGEGVLGVVRAWEARVAALQDFWDAMDEIDSEAVVLDPPRPQRRHTFRRLLLGNLVNVQVSLSPDQPRRLPQWHLFGPSKLTGPMGTRLTRTYEEWDPERSVVENLEHILGEEVVRRDSGGGSGGVEELGVECSVCYELHFDDKLPDQTCEHCCKAFHTVCVYEWLSTLTSSRQTMNMISGECPYCSKNISCKIPT
ncbi:E3 ubiquitin-protein ligase FANCL-like isoform X2 [Eriocheir sinensis]|nr:E3 ubiquitin-protein ligase FANCL-like isoform X2 [Eriocheir sinensis]XP_050698529.1 E3 ubiquitin-protein ligase FANCL-like isoform X2 [Eriocheir sinensis]